MRHKAPCQAACRDGRDVPACRPGADQEARTPRAARGAEKWRGESEGSRAWRAGVVAVEVAAAALRSAAAERYRRLRSPDVCIVGARLSGATRPPADG